MSKGSIGVLLLSLNDIFKYQLENNEEFDRIYGCLGGKEDLVSKMYSSVVNYTLNSTLLELYGEETTWTEKEAFKKLREFNNGNFVLGGPNSAITPVIPVTCANCGNTIMINALAAGLLKE